MSLTDPLAVVCLATAVYAAAAVPVLLWADPAHPPRLRDVAETRAGDRVLVEITRARTGTRLAAPLTAPRRGETRA